MRQERELRMPRRPSPRQEELIDQMVDVMLAVMLGEMHPVYGDRRINKLVRRLNGRTS